jgi:hypothetical protein
MKPLLEIRSVPISIEYKVRSAKIQRADASATIELSRRQNGGYKVRSRPIKISMDTFENRKLPMPSVSSQSQTGPSVTTYHATGQITSSGQFRLNIGFDNPENEPAFVAYGLLPLLPPLEEQPETDAYPVDISDLSIMYEMDKMIFDTLNREELEFIPADIEFTVKEYPGLLIKYLGRPIYIPPSADPEYVPVDTNA